MSSASERVRSKAQGRRLGWFWTTDATVSKIGRIARWLNFAGIIVVNACASILTGSRGLGALDDAVGPGNAEAIAAVASCAAAVVVAHARLPGHLMPHASRMCDILERSNHLLHALRLTPNGVPMHPLGARTEPHPRRAHPRQVWERPRDAGRGET